MRLILGMAAPDSGTISIDGLPVQSAPDRVWAKVGHLIEYPLAYPELTVAQNLMLSGRLHGLPLLDATTASRRVIEEFGLSRYEHRRAKDLSLGNRQRVGLAACLQHDPKFIVLDEPTNALDPSGVLMLRETLVRRAENGAAILVSSHHLDEVARMADQIVVMNNGRIIGKLEPGAPGIERSFFDLLVADDRKEAA
ncbi:MAG: ABC transporter ATP-binding protein, partial [Chloroflexi bacterium]|nr:ABC transporter ATP-binding protein [Chloroflexota bacterium]